MRVQSAEDKPWTSSMLEAIAQNREGVQFPIRSYRLALPSGDAGTKMTVEMMIAKAKGAEGAQHPGVRAFALQSADSAPDRDDWAQATSIYRAVQRRVRFRGEEGETLQTPWLTLQLGAGDCDDFATLEVALLRALGIPARIQTVATGPDRKFAHVFAMVGVREGPRVVEWRALDPTVPGTQPGWQPPHPTRRHYWGGNDLGRADMYTDPQLGSFWSKLKHIAFKGVKIAEGAAGGIVTGNPLMAVKGGASAALSGYQFQRMPRKLYRHECFHAPQHDFDWRVPERAYLGDGMSGLGDSGDFLSSLTTTEKVIGGLALFGIVIAVTK